jgi:hypothetical protein
VIATDDQPWLTALNGFVGTGIDTGSIAVTIDRSHPALAADGNYTATITITSSVAPETVPVTVTVETPVFPDVELFVVAIDVSGVEPVTVAETVVNPSLVGFEYVLDQLSTADGELLPPGEYLIACGSNEDGDEFICGDGDIYCGLFPTLNDPALITVTGTVTGIDFVVAPLGVGPSLAAFQGFRRRAR